MLVRKGSSKVINAFNVTGIPQLILKKLIIKWDGRLE